MGQIKAVFFDIDGTLLDSNDAHARAWLDALHGHGKQVPFDMVRDKIGKGGDKLLMEVAEIDADSLDGKAINTQRSAILKQLYLPDLGPTPGARALVLRLQSLRLRCLAVTSATKDDLAPLLRLSAVADILTEAVTSDDAENSKPSPDLVQVALEKVGVGPREAVMLGDTPFDITAASRAGVSTIAFRTGGWSDRDLRGAIAIYDHPADLLAHLEESVFTTGVGDALPPPSSRRTRVAKPSARP